MALPVGCAALALCSFVRPAAARAEVEYCPAQIGASYTFGEEHPGLRSMYIDAHSERSVSGTVVVDGEKGWYAFPFSNIKVNPDEAQYKNSAVSFTRMEYRSNPIYVQFPVGERIRHMWVNEASSTGDATFGWDAKGVVRCSAPAENDTPSAPKARISDVTRVNPRDDLRVAPDPQNGVIVASAIAVPADVSACATPFTPATVEHAVAPNWPEGVRIGAPIVTLVAVAIDPDSKIKDAWVYQPTGVPEADEAALKSARISRYKAGTALCAPAPGIYLFSATFQP
jgi:hypothetical protein